MKGGGGTGKIGESLYLLVPFNYKSLEYNVHHRVHIFSNIMITLATVAKPVVVIIL